ncbi:pentapeptide repeat-containing protein [Rhodococcus gannanensis]|uniref:Pentapeptide repeat-containing protein n=1 Tax=Rhodococcus gannanensis TaxID=1960308 RepID=A0ABW4P666_9NOCA
MNRSAITTLRRRWSDSDVDDLRGQLLAQSRIVTPPHTVAARWPQTDDGLVDLRGLTVGDGGLDIRFVTLHNVDLSFARGAISAFESDLFDCRFDSVALTRQPRVNRRVERCTFRDATLSRLAVGPTVVDCDFTGATARRLRSVPNTRFERCVFDGADLSGAEFRDASFVDCMFRDARFSATTTFERCAFTRTDIEFGMSRVMRTTIDGVATADRWDGETDAEAALDRYVARYARGVTAGDSATMPLDPE